MKKQLLTLLTLLLVGVSGAWAAEGDVIYQNDFSTKDQTDFATWMAAAKTLPGATYAQLGRVGTFSITSGNLLFTPTVGKSDQASATYSNGAYGTFKSDITTATASKNYVLSFDITLTYAMHNACNTLLEISDSKYQTVIAIYAKHTRSNSTTGSTEYGYYVGGNNAALNNPGTSSSKKNIEGNMGAGTTHAITTVSELTGSKTYNVTLKAETNIDNQGRR